MGEVRRSGSGPARVKLAPYVYKSAILQISVPEKENANFLIGSYYNRIAIQYSDQITLNDYGTVEMVNPVEVRPGSYERCIEIVTGLVGKYVQFSRTTESFKSPIGFLNSLPTEGSPVDWALYLRVPEVIESDVLYGVSDKAVGGWLRDGVRYVKGVAVS